MQWLLIATILLQIPLSYVWMKLPMEKVFQKESSTYFAIRNFRWQSNWEISAIPRLKTQKFEPFKHKIQSVLDEDDGFIVDFISWDVSYNLALHSSVHPDNCFIAPPGGDTFINIEQLEKIFNHTDCGILLLNIGSQLDTYLQKITLEFRRLKIHNRSITLKEISSPEGTRCFAYKFLEKP